MESISEVCFQFSLASVVVVFVLTYWIPKGILIQCDLDKADVFNLRLTKPTWTIFWFLFPRKNEVPFSSSDSSGQILATKFDTVSHVYRSKIDTTP